MFTCYGYMFAYVKPRVDRTTDYSCVSSLITAQAVLYIN